MRKFLLLWLLAGVVPLGTAGPVQGGEQTLKVGRNVVYGEPAAAFVDGVMVQPERKGAGVERLISLGTIRGFTPSAYLEAIQAGSIRLEQSNHFSSLLRKAASGRVGGAYINVDVARYFLENVAQRPGALVFDPALPHVRDSYFLSTVDHPTVIAEFNAFLRNQKHRISELKKRFGIRDEFPEDVALGGEQG